jgi:SAM-dependent methyltransferase
VAPGTWDYVHERSIANHYDAFVADTPLCRLDQSILSGVFPGPDRPEVVLDLGCGSGRAAIPLATRGYQVIAIDLSQAMLEVTRRKWSACDLAGKAGRLLPLRANLVQLDGLADRSADHAVCLFSTFGMIEGRANRQQMLRHLSRIVRPGGSLLVHVHHRWAALRERGGCRNLFRSWLRSTFNSGRDFGDATYAYRGIAEMYMHRFSKRELLSDLTKSRWRLESLWPVSIDGAEIASRWTIPGGYLAHASLRPSD